MGLTVSRRVGDTIWIGEDIIVTIVAIDGNKIKVTVQAPKDIVILRGELKDKILQERMNATGNAAESSQLSK